MPKLRYAVPKYRREKRFDLAMVTLGRGRDIYLGPWKSARSRALYDQLIAMWLPSGQKTETNVSFLENLVCA